jgi:hypothetical protein
MERAHRGSQVRMHGPCPHSWHEALVLPVGACAVHKRVTCILLCATAQLSALLVLAIVTDPPIVMRLIGSCTVARVAVARSPRVRRRSGTATHATTTVTMPVRPLPPRLSLTALGAAHGPTPRRSRRQRCHSAVSTPDPGDAWSPMGVVSMTVAANSSRLSTLQRSSSHRATVYSGSHAACAFSHVLDICTSFQCVPASVCIALCCPHVACTAPLLLLCHVVLSPFIFSAVRCALVLAALVATVAAQRAVGNSSQVAAAVAFADANWNCLDVDCSKKVPSGSAQPVYGCAPFVAHALAAGDWVPRCVLS